MDEAVLKKEITYKTARSGGPGGQHANKVSTKVILYFDLGRSHGLNPREKTILSDKLEKRLTTDGLLILSCDSSRSQLQNKNKVTERFISLLRASLKRTKRRIATRASRRVKQKRADQKKRHSEKKAMRRKSNFD